MKVILLRNIQKLGKLGDIKEVSTGYARNFLLPQGLAEEATPGAVANIEASKTKASAAAQKELAEFTALAQSLEGQAVEISAKASGEGTLYASLAASTIVDALEKKGFNLKKKQIEVGHIKTLGKHELTIHLDHGLEARIMLNVKPE